MGIEANESSKNKIEEIKDEIANYINKSFNKSLNKSMYVNTSEILKWKNTILYKIFKDLDGLIKVVNDLNLNKVSNTNNSYNLVEYKIQKIERLNYITPKKEYKIESTRLNYLALKDFIKIENKQKEDYFTSKDIQDENKEITRSFQKEAYNYMNSEEEIENENVAYFLKNVAEISRKSYYEANNLFKSLLNEFNKITNNKKINHLDKEQIKKEFSSWVKKYEKNNIFKEDKNKENEKSKFLSDLNYKLKKMYLHCTLSFPYVEISFEKEEKFNSEKMIDFINRGYNRKVNFVILPSLYSNGNYLQNGKLWVFTYNKNTFYFKDSELKNLNNNNIKINEKIPNIIKNLKIIIEKKKSSNDEYCIVNTNYKISKKIKCSYLYYLRDKNNYIKKIPSEDRHLKIPKNFTIEKCDLIIGNKVITSNLI